MKYHGRQPSFWLRAVIRAHGGGGGVRRRMRMRLLGAHRGVRAQLSTHRTFQRRILVASICDNLPSPVCLSLIMACVVQRLRWSCCCLSGSVLVSLYLSLIRVRARLLACVRAVTAVAASDRISKVAYRICGACGHALLILQLAPYGSRSFPHQGSRPPVPSSLRSSSSSIRSPLFFFDALRHNCSTTCSDRLLLLSLQ